jgi:uncharacterized OB-fold protein
MDASELITIPGKWDFDYKYFAGETGSRFFNEIKHNARIMGRRCPKSGKVLVPARSFSDATYMATEEWVEAGPGGTLDLFTIVDAQFPGLPEPPYVVAYVTLDNADTAILNFVTGIDLSDINRAAAELMKRPRVKAVFASVRHGRITDFHFELESARR